MRRVTLLLIILLLATSARIQKLNLHQQRRDAMESFHLMRSAEVALEIPLTGNMTWKDMLGK